MDMEKQIATTEAVIKKKVIPMVLIIIMTKTMLAIMIMQAIIKITMVVVKITIIATVIAIIVIIVAPMITMEKLERIIKVIVLLKIKIIVSLKITMKMIGIRKIKVAKLIQNIVF